MTEAMLSSPRLELIHRSPTPQSLVIVVPGVDTALPQKWSHPRPNWLKHFSPRSLPAPAIYSFTHNVDSEERRTWKNMVDEGGILLEAVMQLKDNNAEVSRFYDDEYISRKYLVIDRR
ncbi:hypothetical protein P153DRAFT_117349 [Dothidotthia symphoricarpi CBS 119687]|uniref:Uncharacterized protein n=1 Tax=Dothidotthia symphoricarpi CBS 119687 TaxID=1392245 RepID=A0A6A5ZZI5_9PLEO|nr:uncharacterized protein P153DRAFT_117349 [Dothidotthia symphoricarpi CBS 119687]KAF2124979.1 hypothetical protein P153DRAFT_117349 [Dothidotthia symphoricarpi CBS 119687]